MITKRNPDYFIRLAIQEALKGKQAGNRPYGSVVVDRDGNILAKAHATVHMGHDPTAHAETSALKKAAKRQKNHKLEGCSLYSTAEPCIMCMGACIWARIAHVYFGVTLDDLVTTGHEQVMMYDREIAQKAPWPIQVTGGILRRECLKLYE